MGTINPKVSAYVPQPIKDRLTEFREERSLSESQAVIAILAEYFQMEELIERSGKASQVGGVTLARMEALEEKLIDVAASLEYRLQQLKEEIGKISRLPVVYQVVLESAVSENEQCDSSTSEPLALSQEPEQVVVVGGEQISSLPDELSPEPLNQEENKDEKLEELQQVDNSVLPSEPLSEGRQGTDQRAEANFVIEKKPSEPLVNLLGEPVSELPVKLSGMALSRRLGVNKSTIRNNQSKHDFSEWSRNRDQDKVAWKHSAELKGFIPDSELDNELLSRLRKWIKEDSVKQKT